jgi:hypothetical protein
MAFTRFEEDPVMAVDPRIIDTLTRYGEPTDGNIWFVQNSAVIYHRAVERIAAKAGIVFGEPTILRAERDETAILVRGRLGDRWDYDVGEAHVGVNYRVTGRQAAYPWAMALKRGRDRLILKLIGLHGLLYSEEEADEFRREGGGPPAPDMAGMDRKDVMAAAEANGVVDLPDGEVTRDAALRRKVESSTIGRKIAACKTIGALDTLVKSEPYLTYLEGLAPDVRDWVRRIQKERAASLPREDQEALIEEITDRYAEATTLVELDDTSDAYADRMTALTMANRERILDCLDLAKRRIRDAAAAQEAAHDHAKALDDDHAKALDDTFDSVDDYRNHVEWLCTRVPTDVPGERLKAFWNETKPIRAKLGMTPEATRALMSKVSVTLEQSGVPTRHTAKAQPQPAAVN